MTTDYIALTNSLSQTIQQLREEIPDVGRGFSSLATAAMVGKSLDKKTKELIAIGIAVSSRCEGCIGFHVKAAVHLGANFDEVMEVLGIAVYMGGGPSLMYAAEALDALKQFQALKEQDS